MPVPTHLRRLAPAVYCGVLAVYWTFPLVLTFGTRIPGDGFGDNVASLWNLWWVREALSNPRASLLRTDLLFAPAGVDLTLHTHTASLGVAAATVLAPLSLVAAFNALVLVSFWLTAYATFRVAERLTGSAAGAVAAAAIASGSSYMTAHLLGHLNLLAAWALPVAALATGALRTHPTLRNAVLAGSAGALVAWTDYYLLVYALVLAVMWWGLAGADLRPFDLGRRGSRLSVAAQGVCAGLCALAALTAALIEITGGTTLRVGGSTIGLRGSFNLRTAAWLLFLAFLLARYRPVVALAPRARRDGRHRPALLAAAVVFALGVAPLAAAAARTIARGDYVAPPSPWRSATQGIDVLSPVLPSPLHPLWGTAARTAYARLGLDPVEQVAWLGVAPILLLLVCLPGLLRAAGAAGRAARRWLAIAAVFFVWALGPFLLVAGTNTGFVLPAVVLRLLPVLSNARMPGRAMVGVHLAVALLVALAIAGRRRPVMIGTLVTCAVLVDYAAAPFPTVPIEPPRACGWLARQAGPGAVLHVPTGWRDGFGEVGVFDHRVLLCQTVHGRPIVGGFAARLPRSSTTAYHTPLIEELVRLSARARESAADVPVPAQQAVEALDRLGVGWIVLDRASAQVDLVRVVERLPVVLAAEEGDWAVYRVIR